MPRTSRPARRWLALLLLSLSPLPGALAAPAAQGRWQGWLEIPGAPQELMVDLATAPAMQWVGSAILPGRGVKGAPLAEIQVGEAGVQFSLAAAFGSAPPGSATEARLRWQPDGRLAGTFHQGGWSAPLLLTRSGPPQVDLAPAATKLSADLVGIWRGRYELGGYPREVTLTLSQPPDAAAQGELVIVGKRRSVLAIDHVQQGASFVTLAANAAGLRIEGRWRTDDGRIEGHLVQGPFEAALVLRRDAAASKGKP